MTHFIIVSVGALAIAFFFFIGYSYIRTIVTSIEHPGLLILASLVMWAAAFFSAYTIGSVLLEVIVRLHYGQPASTQVHTPPTKKELSI